MLWVIFLPWPLKRRVLSWLFGYKLHPTSRIRLAWVFPHQLILEEGAAIEHLTVCKNLSLLHVKRFGRIGRGNWITGFPKGHSKHFVHQPERLPQLILG